MAAEIYQGADVDLKLTLRDDKDAPITTFGPSAALAGKVWPGGDRAVSLVPTLSWIDAAAGTIHASIAGADTAGLAVGTYLFTISITASGATRIYPVGQVKVKAVAGSSSAASAYTTAQDLRDEAPWVDSLQSESQQAGFAREQGLARDWFDDLLHRHYRGNRLLRRQSSMDYWLDAWGRRYGRYYRSGARTPELTGWLAAGGLILTTPIRRACALHSLALVCRAQMAPGKGNPYRAAAAEFFGQADDLACTITAEIDTSDPLDGVADVTIELGTIDTLRA